MYDVVFFPMGLLLEIRILILLWIVRVLDVSEKESAVLGYASILNSRFSESQLQYLILIVYPELDLGSPCSAAW